MKKTNLLTKHYGGISSLLLQLRFVFVILHGNNVFVKLCEIRDL